MSESGSTSSNWFREPYPVPLLDANCGEEICRATVVGAVMLYFRMLLEQRCSILGLSLEMDIFYVKKMNVYVINYISSIFCVCSIIGLRTSAIKDADVEI